MLTIRNILIPSTERFRFGHRNQDYSPIKGLVVSAATMGSIISSAVGSMGTMKMEGESLSYLSTTISFLLPFPTTALFLPVPFFPSRPTSFPWPKISFIVSVTFLLVSAGSFSFTVLEESRTETPCPGACGFRGGWRVDTWFGAATIGWMRVVGTSADSVSCRFTDEWAAPEASDDVHDLTGFGCAF